MNKGLQFGVCNHSEPPKRTLATEKAVACLQGKASVQCEDIQTMTKHIYIHEMEEAGEIHLPDLKWSIRQFKMPGNSTGFPGLYRGQVRPVR